MKKLIALFIAAAFGLTLGIAAAEENSMPWQEMEKEKGTDLMSMIHGKDKNMDKKSTSKEKGKGKKDKTKGTATKQKKQEKKAEKKSGE